MEPFSFSHKDLGMFDVFLFCTLGAAPNVKSGAKSGGRVWNAAIVECKYEFYHEF